MFSQSMSESSRSVLLPDTAAYMSLPDGLSPTEMVQIGAMPNDERAKEIARILMGKNRGEILAASMREITRKHVSLLFAPGQLRNAMKIAMREIEDIILREDRVSVQLENLMRELGEE